jgi:Tat protein secretion system quality control protein TatD with DNase activity
VTLLCVVGPFAQIDGKALAPWQAMQAVELLGALWNVDTHSVETILRENLRRLVTQP